MNLRNLGKHILAIPFIASYFSQADAANDTEVVMELNTFTAGVTSDSMVVAVNVSAVLAEDETLDIPAIQVITDTDNTFADPTVVKATGAIALTGGAGGSVEEFLANLDIDLVDVKAATGLRFTPSLSSVSTTDLDYCKISVGLVIGGFPELPPTGPASDAGIHLY